MESKKKGGGVKDILKMNIKDDKLLSLDITWAKETLKTTNL